MERKREREREGGAYTASSCSFSCSIPLLLLLPCWCRLPFSRNNATSLIIILISTTNEISDCLESSKSKKLSIMIFQQTVLPEVPQLASPQQILQAHLALCSSQLPNLMFKNLCMSMENEKKKA